MKKILLLILCIALTFAVITACGNGTSEIDSGDTQAPQPPDASESGAQVSGNGDTNLDEHVTFSWWSIAHPGDYYVTLNDNPVVNYLQYRFNVTLDFVHPVVGTEADALALMMGTGNYTDVIALAVYGGSIERLYEDGIIILT